MTNRLDLDDSTPEPPFLPFSPGQLDRSGLRLTRAEFARFMEVSKQAVGEWVTSGKVTLGADGRLDPRQAVSQLLRNSDPARLRTRVLAPLVQDVGNLHKRIAELEADLSAAKEEAAFHEEATMQLAGQLIDLQRHLQNEEADLASLPGRKIVAAILAWLSNVDDVASAPDLGILDCLPVSDTEQPAEYPGAPEKKNGEGESADG